MLPDPDGESYPVIPEHLRSLAGIGEALSRHGRRFGHRASFHGIRAPRYLLLAVVYGRGRGVPARGPPAVLVVAV